MRIPIPSILVFLFATSLFLAGLFPSSLLAEERMIPIEGEGRIKGFLLDKFEVTQKDFLAFQKATIYKHLPMYPKHPLKLPLRPMARVHWFEAADFCAHHGKRLPTLAEWELAAGLGKRIYPWGDDKPTGEHANFCDVNCVTSWSSPLDNDHHQKTADVGSYPKGRTPEGAYDMAGNLWEWTATKIDGTTLKHQEAKDYKPEDMEAILYLKGGSYGVPKSKLINEARVESAANMRQMHVGFRCAKDL